MIKECDYAFTFLLFVISLLPTVGWGNYQNLIESIEIDNWGWNMINGCGLLSQICMAYSLAPG